MCARVVRGLDRARRCVIGMVMGLSVIGVLTMMPGSTVAQTDSFPRTVTDLTGQQVIILARPTVIGVAGTDTVLAQLVSIEHLRIIEPFGEPPHGVWADVGLLVIPDLYAAANPALVAGAEQASVPVFRTTAITSLALWRNTVNQLGMATGREDRALNLMLQLDRRLTGARRIRGDQPPPRVVVLTPEGYTFGVGALITDLITAAGGVNVAAEAGFADYRQLTDAALHALAPDIILLTPAWDREMFMVNAAYSEVPAVQTGRVIRLPFSPTNPFDPGRAVVLLAWVLHPLDVLGPFFVS